MKIKEKQTEMIKMKKEKERKETKRKEKKEKMREVLTNYDDMEPHQPCWEQ